MRYTLLAIIFMVSLKGTAQTDTTSNQGKITMGEVIIEKEKEIVLPQTDKRYRRAMVRTFDNEPLSLNLEVKEPDLTWPPYKSDVPFEQVVKPYPEPGYQNYFRLGYGNYGSPLAEVGIFQQLGVFQTSGKLFHESFQSGPVGDENSGNSVNAVALSAVYKSDGFQISPQLHFQHNQYRFYGNTNRVNTGFDLDNLAKVNFSNVGFDVRIKGTKEDFGYNIKPMIEVTDQNISGGAEINRESVVGAEGGIGFKIDERFATGFDLAGYSASYQGGLTYDRSLFSLNPWVNYRSEGILLKGGFNLATGTSGEERQSGFYPDFEAEWSFTEKWLLYGNLSGNVSWNGLSALLSENEFLDDSLTIRNIENSFAFGGGLKGSPAKNLVLDANLKLINLKNLPFYVPSSTDSARFTLVFDDQTVNQVTFKTSVSFAPTTLSTYSASLELNTYSVSTIDRPWHLPSYIVNVSTSHNVKEKLLFSADLIAMGGIKAPADVDFGIVELRSFIDFGIDLKYLISKRTSAWVEVNNIGNNEYERYLGYPLRAINFKIGAQYRF